MKFFKFFLILVFCIFVSTGCNRQVDLTEEEAFQGVDDTITDDQINIHFALKERPLHKWDYFIFGLSIESPWQKSKILGIAFSPIDEKLGIKIKTTGNEWMIENLYREKQGTVYNSDNEIPRPGGSKVDERVQNIYKNAEWKLVPSKDVYHIWINDYYEDLENPVEPTELFRLVDQTTDTEFIVRLEKVIMNTDGWEYQKKNGIVE